MCLVFFCGDGGDVSLLLFCGIPHKLSPATQPASSAVPIVSTFVRTMRTPTRQRRKHAKESVGAGLPVVRPSVVRGGDEAEGVFDGF